MKKLLISLALLFCFITPTQKAHALDPKAKAFMVMTAYGTVGGALLGFATLAFGSNSRAIAQGASLGLYAGIAFGAYVIHSHQSSLNPEPYEDPYDPYAPQDPYARPPANPYSPYNQQPAPGYANPPPVNQPPAGGGGFGAPVPEEESGGFFGGRASEIMDKHYRSFQPLGSHTKPLKNIPIYFNLYNASF